MRNFTEGSANSADGTRLGFLAAGNGPAIVLVHGAFTVADDWLNVADLLANKHQVFVFDRRGRGRSGDAAVYSFAREIEDVEAIVRKAGTDADLFGHSFGATLSIAYALKTGFARSLVLYEPPGAFRAPVGGPKLQPVQDLLGGGKRDEALVLAHQTITQMPPFAIEGFRASPFWQTHLSTLPQFIRECQGLDGFLPSAQELAGLACRTTLLLGSESQGVVKETAGALVEQMKALTVLPIMGHGHVCHLFDPKLMTERIETALAM
jgi:pimeloyl-ACP methyl ester carboxylesterase